MENYDKAMNLSTISANSAGSALEKFGIYQESTQAKLSELTNQFQIFSNRIGRFFYRYKTGSGQQWKRIV